MNESKLIREFMTRANSLDLKVEVPASGSPDAEIAIVAEAPAKREKEMRMPLVGPSGKLLWDVMNSPRIGIRRNRCYVTNVCKRLLPNDKKGKMKIPSGELQHWEALLNWELSQLPNLKYVVLLGDFALQAVARQKGINKWRGSVIPVKVDNKTVQAIIVNHPAAALHEPKMEVLFRFHLAKLKKVVEGNFKPYEIEHLINPTFDEAMAWIDKMEKDGLPVAVDIEFTGTETACIGLTNDPHKGMCIPFRSQHGHYWELEQEIKLRKRLQDLFAKPEVRFVAQNGNFDCYWLHYKDNLWVHRIWFDTMLAHHALYPQLPHGLDTLTAQYTNHPFYKDDKDVFYEGGSIDDYWRYNVKDICITLACYQKLERELIKQNLADLFFNHIMRLNPELTQMTVTGVRIDEGLKNQIADELSADVQALKEKYWQSVEKATNDPELHPNPGSPPQTGKLLFGTLGLIGRGFSTDKHNLERIKAHPRTSPEARQVVEDLLEWRKENKFLSTYANMAIDDDGRIRCEYKQIGVQAAPGRLSSTGNMWGSGTNLQNQPHRAYPMFIADRGFEFSYFDLSQAEARVVAWAWEVEALKENFRRALQEEGFDVHRANAARIFKLPYAEIPVEDWDEDGNPTKRYLGKRCVHGLNYRMGPDKLATVCKIPLHQATVAYNSYHAAFPQIRQAWDRIAERARRDKELFTVYGRRLKIMERITDEALESIVAFEPQSTIGDKASSCIYRCHDHPDWPKIKRHGRVYLYARCILNIHDAVIALNRPKDGETVRAIMKEVAEDPLIINGEEVLIPADVKKSVPDEDGIHRWSNLEKA